MPPRFQAALFDLDGTLIDTEPAHLDAESRALDELGVNPFDAHRPRTFGMGDENGVRILASTYGLEYLRLLVEYLRAWESTLQNGVQLMPGASALLDGLRQRAVPIGLVTSGDRKNVEKIGRSLDLAGYFAVVVTVEDVTRTKPHPDPYLRGVERLGLPISAVVGFEDSGPGVSALLSAGIYAVAVHRQVAERHELRAANVALRGLDALEPATIANWFG